VNGHRRYTITAPDPDVRLSPSYLDAATLAEHAKQRRSGHPILLSDVASVYTTRHFGVPP